MVAIQNRDKNVDPSFECSWLHQIWKQFHAIGHVKDLGDQNQNSQLVIGESLSDVSHHHVLQVWDEHLTDFYHELSFCVNFVLESPDELLEGPKPNNLTLLGWICEISLDLRD